MAFLKRIMTFLERGFSKRVGSNFGRKHYWGRSKREAAVHIHVSISESLNTQVGINMIQPKLLLEAKLSPHQLFSHSTLRLLIDLATSVKAEMAVKSEKVCYTLGLVRVGE